MPLREYECQVGHRTLDLAANGQEPQSVPCPYCGFPARLIVSQVAYAKSAPWADRDGEELRARYRAESAPGIASGELVPYEGPRGDNVDGRIGSSCELTKLLDPTYGEPVD